MGSLKNPKFGLKVLLEVISEQLCIYKLEMDILESIIKHFNLYLNFIFMFLFASR